MKKLFFAAVPTLLIAGGLASCQDELKLADAEAVYITITPENPYLTIAQDTIEMSATVKNLDGKAISDAEIKWSSDDETVVKFLEGTTKLVAVRGGEGKSTLVRATLQNGKAATMKVSVSKVSAGAITPMLDPKTPMGDTLYVATGATMDFLVVTRPAQLLKVYTPEITGIDEAQFTIAPRVLDPKVDSALIADTPAGGIWYTVRPGASRGKPTTIAYTVGSNSLSLPVKIGTRVADDTNQYYGVALNPGMSEAELSRTVNIGQEGEVIVYVKATPSTEEAFNEIKNDLVWKTAGSGGVITETSSEYKDGTFLFKAKVKAGMVEGEFSVSATIQGKTARQSFRVENFANKPFTSLTFGKITTMELQTGEQKPLTLAVNPRSSQSAILADVNNMVSFSTAGIAEFINDNGVYQLRGLAAGETELIVKVTALDADKVNRRTQTFRLPIKVVAAPRSIKIDDTTPVGVMVGDVVTWSAVVEMAGTDAPNYSLLKWSSANPNAATISGSATGRTVQLLGKAEASEITIEADYRGLKKDRKLTVYPVQPNAEFANAKIDASQSGMLYGSSALDFVLLSSAGNKLPNNIVIKPKSGTISHAPGKTYDASNYDIKVVWGSLDKLATSGTVAIAAGSSSDKINVTFNLTLALASGHQIKVTGTLTDLQTMAN